VTTVRGDPIVEVSARDRRYPWVAMGVVLSGTLMVILDTTIVNVALAKIGVALHSGEGIEWVVTAYLLAVGLMTPLSGWLSDRYGRKQIFTVALLLFLVGSTSAALAPSLGVLVACRVVQGAGGGLLAPVGMALVYDLFPPNRRGTALGVWGVAAMAAPALGPVVGGYIVDSVSWRWLFAINIPIGTVGLIAAHRLLRDSGERRQQRFDVVGLAVGGTGLVLFLLGMSEAPRWGWASASTITTMLIGVVLLVVFAIRLPRVEDPLIDPEVLHVRQFRLTLLITALLTVLQYARLVFIPLELQNVRSMGALEVGWVLSPSALATAVTMPIGGRLADRVGPRPPVLAGTTLIAVAAWFLAHLDLDTSKAELIGIFVLQGLGTGLALMPVTVAGMNHLPGRLVSQGSGLRNLNRQVAAALAVALLSSLVASQIGGSPQRGSDDALGAYNSVFLVGLLAAVAAVVLATFLPNRSEMRAVNAQRDEEIEALRVDVG
jgi:EmrB/QacA subfamily drug resistance transporter